MCERVRERVCTGERERERKGVIDREKRGFVNERVRKLCVRMKERGSECECERKK